MKFGETLATLLTPEWRTQYIEYEALKSQLYQAQEEAPSAEVVGEEILRRYYARFDENFLVQCEKELSKINTFFSEKLAEAVRKWAGLKAELESYKEIARKQPWRGVAAGSEGRATDGGEKGGGAGGAADAALVRGAAARAVMTMAAAVRQAADAVAAALAIRRGRLIFRGRLGWSTRDWVFTPKALLTLAGASDVT